MRNKIYITSKTPTLIQNQLCFIDVGNVLASTYKNNPKEFEKESYFDSFSYFRKIINNCITNDKTRIVFSNIGILLENDFSLDVPRFLLEYAKDYQVFILKDQLNIKEGNKLVWNIDNPENKIEFDQGIIELSDLN